VEAAGIVRPSPADELRAGIVANGFPLLDRIVRFHWITPDTRKSKTRQEFPDLARKLRPRNSDLNESGQPPHPVAKFSSSAVATF